MFNAFLNSFDADSLDKFTGGKRMLVTAVTSIQDGARRIRSELSGLISRRKGLKMVNFYE